MSQISAEMVKKLREETSAGVLDCKKALEEHGGDFEQAAEYLRKKGLAKAANKASREANEGTIGSYIHTGSKVASLVKLNCETDFVARNDSFQQLARDLALHVTASNPIYVSRDEIPSEVIEQFRTTAREELESSGKSAEVLDRIIVGKLDKWFTESVLVEQPYVRNPDVTVGSLIVEAIAKLGENVKIGGFSRLQIGD